MTVRSPEALIRAAVGQTGLADFGGDAFREGLDVLVASINADIVLTPGGEQLIEGTLVRCLANRLQVEAWYGAHPEVADTPIRSMTLVVGLPRSGTTALVGMLAQDRRFRSLRQWEAAEPCPPPRAETEADDPRVRQAKELEGVIPEELKALHIMDPLGPEEDQEVLGMGFTSGHYNGFWPVTSYSQWWLGCDMRPAWAHHERVLKLLGSQSSTADWLLKAPLHLFELEHFLKRYPDTRFVMTHRDPARTVPSVCSLMRHGYGSVTDDLHPERHGPEQLAFWSEGMRRGMAARARIGEDRFLDVHHRDLVADPMGEVARIYDFVGRELDATAATAIEGYIERERAAGPPQHHYTAEEFGLTAEAIRADFASYLDHFDVLA